MAAFVSAVTLVAASGIVIVPAPAHVLFSRSHFSAPSGDRLRSRYSDHKVLQGWAARH